MEDNGERAAARTTWFLLLRRSQGIPDAVDAENAITLIAGRLAARIEGQGEKGSSTKTTKEAAAALIDALLDLGTRGELDDCLVLSDAMVSDIKQARGFAEPPCRRITDAAAYPGADKRVWVPLTEFLGRIGDLARRELRTPWLWRQP